jgi:asparagine synthetase B (glutamine-hydrolysing)
MCGVAGGFNFVSGPEPVDQTVVARLNEFRRHRGPDGEGYGLPMTDGLSSGIAA